MNSVAAPDLSPQSILKLLQDAGVEAQLGPEGDDYVEAQVGEFSFLVQAFPEQQVVKVWTAMLLDDADFDRDAFLYDINRFNENFLLVRNFIVGEPDKPAETRVIWDHDRLVGPEGLTSEMLASMLSRVAAAIMQAFEGPDAGSA